MAHPVNSRQRSTTKAALYTPYRPNLVAQSAWFTDDFFSCDTQPSPPVIIGASAPIHKTRKPSAITPEGVTFKKVHDAGPIAARQHTVLWFVMISRPLGQQLAGACNTYITASVTFRPLILISCSSG